MTTVNALSEIAALMGDPARASMLALGTAAALISVDAAACSVSGRPAPTAAERIAGNFWRRFQMSRWPTLQVLGSSGE